MLQFFKKTGIKKTTAAFLLVCLSSFSFHAQASGELVIPAGTRIELETVQNISSETIQPGETVDFKVRSDVSVNNTIVIKAGTIAKGIVVTADHAKGVGKEGNVEIQVKNVQAVDGTLLPLSSNPIARKGENNATLSIILGVLVCLLFLLIKGKNGVIPSGTSLDAIVASNVKISA
ncbi:hypothetical protein V7S76_06295 [Aquirufa sp. ROCK2-A2]